MLKNSIFTLAVILSVALAMSFPDLLLDIAGFKTTNLIVPLLMLIMFGMGTSIGVKDFYRVAKMPKAVGVGMLCQFTIMPIVGFTLAYMSGLPPEIAAGIILVGCSPGGLASNVMVFISGGNLALSLTLTSFSTLLAPFVTPFLMSLLAGQYVPIDSVAMFWSIAKIVILPVMAGLVFHELLHGKFPIVDKAMPIVSMVGIVLIIAVITAAGRDSLLSIGLVLVAVAIAHNLLGLMFGYFGARLFGLGVKDARTVAFEVGMQNSGLASGIAVEMGKVATMGLAPAVFGPFMNIIGSIVASFWRARPPQNEVLEEESPNENRSGAN